MRTERQRQHVRNHYATHKDQYLERNRRRKREMAEHIRAAKDASCTDCGKRYPYYVMDFDHCRGTKRGDIHRYQAWASSMKVLQAEIDKCDLVCSNCHRERTHQRSL